MGFEAQHTGVKTNGITAYVYIHGLMYYTYIYANKGTAYETKAVFSALSIKSTVSAIISAIKRGEPIATAFIKPVDDTDQILDDVMQYGCELFSIYNGNFVIKDTYSETTLDELMGCEEFRNLLIKSGKITINIPYNWADSLK